MDKLARVLGIVSIHAPAWGATQTLTFCSSVCKCFNPRSRVGSDKALLDAVVIIKRFNPRSRVGSDQKNHMF